MQKFEKKDIIECFSENGKMSTLLNRNYHLIAEAKLPFQINHQAIQEVKDEKKTTQRVSNLKP